MEAEAAPTAADAVLNETPAVDGDGMHDDKIGDVAATAMDTSEPAAAGEGTSSDAAETATTGNDTVEPAAANDKPAHNPPPTNPNKKRKVALFLAYVGHGYNGMQRNPGVKTIEEDLFKAIHAAGGISDANSDEQGFIKASM
jgi:hypothetical protein